MVSAFARLTMLLVLAPASVAVAQSAGTAAASSATPFGALGVDQLQPGRWTYDARIVTPGGPPRRISLRTLALAPATYEGTEAWLIVDSRRTRAVVVAESLYVDRRTLAPLHRALHTSDADLDVRFTDDSITGSYRSGGTSSVIALANEPGLVSTLYEAEVLMQLLPLEIGWRGHAALLAVGAEESATVPMEVEVTGEEHARLPTGFFDCWVVAVRIGDGAQTLWVRKADRVVIKSSAPVLGMPNAALEQVLASSK